jgi:hypothetical protein
LQAAFLIPEGAIILFTNDYSAPYQKRRGKYAGAWRSRKGAAGQAISPWL